MQKKIIIPLLSVTMTAFANSPTEILPLLNVDYSPKVMCSEGTNERDFSQCLTSVCGDPKKSQNYEDVIAAASAAPLPADSKFPLIKKNIEDYYQKLFANKKQTLEALKKLIESDNVEIDASYLPLHKFITLTTVYGMLPFEELIESYGGGIAELKFNLKTDKLHDALVTKFGEAKANMLQGPILEFMDNPGFKKIIFGSQYGWTISNDQLYPNKNIQEIIDLTLKDSLAFLDQMKIQNPKLAKAMEAYIEEFIKKPQKESAENDFT